MRFVRFLFLSEPLEIRHDRTVRCVTTVHLRESFPIWMLLFLVAWHVLTLSVVSAIGLAALGGVILIAGLWARAMAYHVSGNRKLLYAALQVGDELQEMIDLINRSSFPILWAEFVDRSDLPGYALSSVRAVDPWHDIRWRAGAICNRRGVFKLGPWELRLGDPFGIFLVRHVFHQPEEILVYPPLAVLPADLLPEGGAAGEHRPLPQPLLASTIHAVSTRPYLPGDALRHIHWPTTARKDEHHVKSFEPEGTSTVWLILDLEAKAHIGSGADSSEEVMVTLAASLARDYLQRRLAVGLFVQAGEQTVVLPQRGLEHFWSLLRGLAPLHATAEQPLAQSIRSAGTLISPSHLAVVITPSLNTDWAAHVMTHIRPGGGGVLALVLEPASFGFDGDMQACITSLLKRGVLVHPVAQHQVKPVLAAYGEIRRWEFITFATGKAVLRNRPREVDLPPLAG